MLEVENKYKEVKRENEEIETVFNNPLYKDEPEQLKYNLYKYEFKEYKEENEKKWFLNNAILRLSDI